MEAKNNAPPIFIYLFIKQEIPDIQETIGSLKIITSEIIKSFKTLFKQYSWKKEENIIHSFKLLDTLTVQKKIFLFV